MTLLDIKRIKGINHIVFLKCGTWYGFGRESDAKKFIHKSGGNFLKWYSWSCESFFCPIAAYYLNDE